MNIKVQRKKQHMVHLYFVHEQGRSVARVITDAPESFIFVRGHRRVSYNSYLRSRRALRLGERKEK